MFELQDVFDDDVCPQAPIDVDVTAEELGVFFELLGSNGLSRTCDSIPTDVAATQHLLELADKYDTALVADWATRRMSTFDPWDRLAYASLHNNVEMGKAAIRAMSVRPGPHEIWNKIDGLDASWRIPVARCIMKDVSVTSTEFPRLSILLDFNAAADNFEPTAHM